VAIELIVHHVHTQLQLVSMMAMWLSWGNCKGVYRESILDKVHSLSICKDLSLDLWWIEEIFNLSWTLWGLGFS
jgi:hypothetical protein